MTSLTGDIINRVRRLPKPTSAAEALQPVFEAVSNAMHAIEDRVDAFGGPQGSIRVWVELAAKGGPLTVVVSDEGIGMDDIRFGAFITTDTGFKSGRGGKGVGRLLWLDAFESIKVVSVFQADGKLFRRSFYFVLAKDDQLQNEELIELAPGSAATGTIVTFRGLRGSHYVSRFPVQPAVIVRHFGSHFLAEFIMGKSPPVDLVIGTDLYEFPAGIADMLVEDRGSSQVDTDEFGRLDIAHYIFKRSASAGFDGQHQLHLIANGRTVLSKKLDGLLGVQRLGPNRDGVYHGCVAGDFLNERVNQERTHFNFDEKTADEITKACAQAVMSDAIHEEVEEYDTSRLQTMTQFLSDYPTFGFSSPEEQLNRTPKNATKPEQFAQALIPLKIRRDVERNREVQAIVRAIGEGTEVTGNFAERVREAADNVRAEEQRQLTEYVLRRRLVLEVLDVLVRRLRETVGGQDKHYLESTLHQFICPMKVRGDDPNKVETTDHDLWVLDERLAFARYFASDVPMSQILVGSQSRERPDLFIWDRLHGLGFEGEDPLRRVMLVEFKMPGRTDYTDRYSPSNQIMDYLNDLSDGKVESFRNERVRIAPDCIFHCYIVADIVGELDKQTRAWRRTADGRGRWMELSGDYRGTIELIEWRDLVADARLRNRAFTQHT